MPKTKKPLKLKKNVSSKSSKILAPKKKEKSEEDSSFDEAGAIQQVIDSAKRRAEARFAEGRARLSASRSGSSPAKSASASEEETSGSEAEGETSEENGFRLPEWEPYFKGDGSRGFSMILLASRNSGKSYLIRSLLKSAMSEHFDVAFIICESRDDREAYEDLLENMDVQVSGFDYLPEDLWEKVKRAYDESAEAGETPLRVLFLLDDAVGSSYKNSQSMLKIFCTGRHSGASVIWSTQASKLIDTACKSNADVIFLGKTKSPQQQKSVVENILMGSVELPDDFPPKKEKRFYTDLHKVYSATQGDFLVADQRPEKDRANKGPEELYSYRAPKDDDAKGEGGE